MAAPNQVPRLYQSVIDDVVSNVRESFLDDGVDEQVLQELKQLWESKIKLSKAVDKAEVKAETQQMTGLYAQQQQQRQQQMLQQRMQAQQNKAAAAAQTAVAAAAPAPTVTMSRTPQQPTTSSHQLQQRPGQQMEVQLPMFNQAGQFEVSGAAATAQSALGGIFPGSTVTLQTPNGPMQFIIQAPNVTQQQTGTVTLPTGTVSSQRMGQMDGQEDSSSDNDDDDDDDNDDDDDDKDDDNEEDQGEEEEPLNSDDDVSENDQEELFDTDNVVVCQFDKINRAKNKWKFYLKDGIMNLNGKDYVFQKCNGDAEW